jgi:transposase
MISFRQIEANRRNALGSTGPKTEDGKWRSRRNAVRHGLTAETVVVALEDIEDYHAFEAAPGAPEVLRRFSGTIAWLNRCRRLAKDWENLNRNGLAFLRLASIRLMLRKLCNPV